MKTILCLAMYFICSSLNIYFGFHENVKGTNFTKPFLMPLLLLFYILTVNKINYLVAFALVFAFLGDVFLMMPNGFIIGSIAFLIGHILYIIAFIRQYNVAKGLPLWMYIVLACYVVAGVIILNILLPNVKPSMESMKIIIIVYLVIIFTMSYTTLLSSSKLILIQFIGSLMFILSDTMLAFNKFTALDLHTKPYVMVTYIIGQLLIIIGFI